MKYAAFADLFEGWVHIVGFDQKDLLRRPGEMNVLYPGSIKKHYVFVGTSAEIKMLVNSFAFDDEEIKDTYREAQKVLIDYIFTQDEE